MNVPAFLRPRSHTLAIVAELMLVAALCWLLAGLFWRVLAPASPDLRLSQPAEAPQVRSGGWTHATGWFGSAQGGPRAASALSIRLVAVIAGGEGFSAAILDGVGPTALAARPGDELQPGVKLVAVERDRVRIDHGGRSEEILLQGMDAPPSVAVGSRPVSPMAGAAPAGEGTQHPAAVTGPQLKVTRGVMAGVMQGLNIAEWNRGLTATPDGGIRITDTAAQPFASLLQLQNGDVIKQANGRLLGDVSDMSLIYSQFSQLNQVTLQVLRNGSLVNLQYQIQP